MPLRRAGGKKMQAPLLGLAKSISQLANETDLEMSNILFAQPLTSYMKSGNQTHKLTTNLLSLNNYHFSKLREN